MLNPIEKRYGPWSQYKEGTFGYIIHYVYCICGFNMAEGCSIGSGKVTFYGELIATYEDTTPLILHFKDKWHNKRKWYILNGFYNSFFTYNY